MNIAQRLEANAPTGGILISARTHELLEGQILAQRLDPIRVKAVS